MALSIQERSKSYNDRHRSICPGCGGLMFRGSKRCQPCENRSRIGNCAGKLNNQWKGGRHKRKRDGYIELLVAPYQRELEHRVVWERANGPIPKGWIVHHLNGTKDDNRLENLAAMSRRAHGPKKHIDPAPYEKRIRDLEAQLAER